MTEVDKKHVKHILRSITKAFVMAESYNEYESLCECIFYSDSHLSKADFERLKKLIH